LEPPAAAVQVQRSASWETSFERQAGSSVEHRYRVAVSDGAAEAFFIRAEFPLRVS
jgi:hypothetical protein